MQDREVIMKKKLLSLALCLCVSAMAVTGCKKEEDKSKDDGKKTEASSKELIPIEDDNVEALHALLMKQNGDAALKNTTMADYSNLAISVEKKIEVTDAVFQEEVDNLLTQYAYSFEGEVASGQTVNIDYAGTLDGVAFQGGSANGYDLKIGSGTFIQGFEEQLVGMQVGSCRTINVTFPEDYSSTELAGKETQFVVTANAIALEEGKSELTDQWVKMFLSMSGGLLTDATVDAFNDFYRNYLEEAAVSTRESNEMYAIADEVLKLATLSKEIPKEQTTFYNNMVSDSVESNIQNNYQMTIEEYMEKAGMSQEDFDTQIKSLADERMKYEYAIISIGEKEGITPSEEEYTATLQTYADGSGMDLEAFREQYQSSYQMELYFTTYEEKVLKFLLEKATITDATPEAVSAE